MRDRRTGQDRRAEHPIRDLMAFFDARYQEHAGCKYPFMGGKDAKAIKELRETVSDDEIRTYMAAFFEMDDPFFEQGGHSFSIFRACLPKVMQFVRRKSQPRVMSDAAAQVFRVIGGGKA